MHRARRRRVSRRGLALGGHCRRWQRQLERPSVSLAEIPQVLAAGNHDGVVGREHRLHNGVCPTIALLRVSWFADALARDAQVVQRAREVRVQRAELGFLKNCGLTQELLGRPEIAGGGCMFGCLDNRFEVPKG